MGRILVIGGASLDVLHFAGRTERVPGGAGLYTALAATRAGAEVTLWAPVPTPMPAELQSVNRHLTWIGPIVQPEDLPGWNIATKVSALRPRRFTPFPLGLKRGLNQPIYRLICRTLPSYM